MATSKITVNFQNATLTATTSQIIITNGSFMLDSSSALSMSGTIGFTSLYATTGAIDLSAQTGTAFNASVVAPATAGGGVPTLEVTNFSGTVTVTWPTQNGLQSQMVVSDDPVALDGFTD